jgi:hypothetical protein
VRRLLVYSSLMVAVGISSVVAQAQAASPEEVARQFFKAEDEDRWLDAARLLDLKRFEILRRMTLKGARTIRAPWRLTPEQMMEMDPEMPRAVAEYQASRANKVRSDFNPLEFQFARVPSADSLEALSVEEAAARWLEAQGPKWQEERDRKEAAKRPLVKCPANPDSLTLALAQYKPPKAVVLGAATVGDSVGYVIVGSSFGSQPRRQEFEVGMSPGVMTLVRVNGAWRIVPTGGMLNSTGYGGGTTFSIGCEMETQAKDSSKKK